MNFFFFFFFFFFLVEKQENYWVCFPIVLTFLLDKEKMASPTPSDSSKDALPSIPGCDTIIDLAYVFTPRDSFLD
jgi:hypothetical protein